MVWYSMVWDNIHPKLLWKFHQNSTCFGCFREDLQFFVILGPKFAIYYTKGTKYYPHNSKGLRYTFCYCPNVAVTWRWDPSNDPFWFLFAIFSILLVVRSYLMNIVRQMNDDVMIVMHRYIEINNWRCTQKYCILFFLGISLIRTSYVIHKIYSSVIISIIVLINLKVGLESKSDFRPQD